MFKKYVYSYCSILCLICIFFSFNFDSNKNYNLCFPVSGEYSISSSFGFRQLGSYHFHNGVDIPKPCGTPVHSLSSGTVSYIGFSPSYGNTIVISYYNGYKSLYGHMSGTHPFKVGDSVSYFDIIGYIGPKYLSSGSLNGFTTGTHLHFTLYFKGNVVDPLSVKYF